MKLCLLTKNRFYIDENKLITNLPFSYDYEHLLGFKFEEFNKLVFIGFKEEKEFDGYIYEKLNKSNAFVVGPKFKEEKRYILDRLINIFNILKEIWKNRKIFKDIQIVFSGFFEYTAFIFFFLKLIIPKAKFIVWVGGDYPELNFRKNKSIFLKYFLIFCLRITQILSNEFWFLSNYLFRKYGSFLQNKSIIISTTTLSIKDIATPKSLNRDAIKIIFVGRLEKEKRPHIPVKVTSVLKNEGYKVHLGIVGDGRLKYNIMSLCKDLLNENEYKLYDWIRERHDLLKIISSYDFLIFPSLAGEGLGLVIIEAMSQGLIVISTKCGGPEEIIKDEENGFLIEDKEEEFIIKEISKKIKYLFNNPQIFNKISKSAIEISKNWTKEKIFEVQKTKLLKLLKE